MPDTRNRVAAIGGTQERGARPRIGCVGWGSLIWSPRELPVRGGWREDGPRVPAEFARQSRNDRITLVLLPKREHRVRALWTEVNVGSVEEARKILAHREATNPRWIGAWSAEEGCHPCAVPPGGAGQATAASETAEDPAYPGPSAGAIAGWARGRDLDGVVWTALPPSFEREVGRIPAAEEVIEHLEGLTGRTREVAEEYIRRAPPQVRTPHRDVIEEALGWTPRDEPMAPPEKESAAAI